MHTIIAIQNKVTGPYTAIIRGVSTGLAGCNSINCPRQCLRKHQTLAYRDTFPIADCRLYIPAAS